jgi:hypothetical protein
MKNNTNTWNEKLPGLTKKKDATPKKQTRYANLSAKRKPDNATDGARNTSAAPETEA